MNPRQLGSQAIDDTDIHWLTIRCVCASILYYVTCRVRWLTIVSQYTQYFIASIIFMKRQVPCSIYTSYAVTHDPRAPSTSQTPSPNTDCIRVCCCCCYGAVVVVGGWRFAARLARVTSAQYYYYQNDDVLPLFVINDTSALLYYTRGVLCEPLV